MGPYFIKWHTNEEETKVSHKTFLSPSQAVQGSDSGSKDDHRWTTLAALHPGVITEVARGSINYLNGGRPKNRPIFIYSIFL